MRESIEDGADWLKDGTSSVSLQSFVRGTRIIERLPVRQTSSYDCYSAFVIVNAWIDKDALR